MHAAGLFANPGSAVRSAAAAGLQRLGFRVVFQIPGAWERTQAERGLAAVVVHGIRGRCADIASHYGQADVPVAMFDLPHLRVQGQLRVTPPSHDWLPQFDGAPPLDRLEALGIEPQARKRVKGQAVLLVGQVSGDSAHGMGGGSFRRWAAQTLVTLRSLTDSKVIWRPHPKDRWLLDGVDGFSDPAEESLVEALDRSWLVVTYNSTAGLEALTAGLPVVCEGPAVYSGLAHRLNQFSKVAPPEPDQVRELLAAIAYTQWTPEEIATGLPLDVALRGRVLPGRPVEPEREPEVPLRGTPESAPTVSAAVPAATNDAPPPPAPVGEAKE